MTDQRAIFYPGPLRFRAAPKQAPAALIPRVGKA
jgi:hypothetical protein